MRSFFLLLTLLQTLLHGAPAVEEKPFQSVVLYYSPRCPYSKKVLSYLDSQDIDIPCKNVTIDATARDELKKYGGHLVVPCLIVDQQPIYNANDIIAWLQKHDSYLK